MLIVGEVHVEAGGQDIARGRVGLDLEEIAQAPENVGVRAGRQLRNDDVVVFTIEGVVEPGAAFAERSGDSQAGREFVQSDSVLVLQRRNEVGGDKAAAGYGRYLKRFRPLLDPRALRHVRGSLCVVQNWRGRRTAFPKRDIAAYGRKCGTEDYKWRACLISCQLVLEKGNHRVPVIGGFLREKCHTLFSYRSA